MSWDRRRALLITDVHARTSFEPHPREVPDDQQIVRKPDETHAAGRHFESRPPGTPGRYDDRSTPPTTQSGISFIRQLVTAGTRWA